MRATALLPVKRFGAAKQRLLDVLDRPARAAVVRAMLTDVLGAITAADEVERLIVITGEGRAERIALEHAKRVRTPIEVLRDPHDTGHPEAATLGIIRAISHGAKAVALLPGDCPLLQAPELDAALARLEPGRVAVVPDRHGTGTNALLMSPADAIAPGFGPGSCERHVDRARARDLEVDVEPVASLALDLDTPEDLRELGAALSDDPGLAPATAEALRGIDLSGGGGSG